MGVLCSVIWRAPVSVSGWPPWSLLIASNALQNASAEGDTRTLTMHHVHTGETITVTYKRDGEYDEAALKKLDWFMRDWRRNEETRMDPHLFDILWQAYRETGATKPIEIICGYRSPDTNALLRARSGGVAKFSQHILGKAIDFFIPDVSARQAAGRRPASCSAAASASIRAPARPSSIWTSAPCGTGRAFRASNWSRSSRTAAPCISRATASRCPATPRRWPRSSGAATCRTRTRSSSRAPPAPSPTHDEQVAELVAQDRQQTLVALVNSGRDNGIAKGEAAPLALASLKPIKPTPNKPRMQVASAGPVPLPQVRPTFVTLASVESKPLAGAGHDRFGRRQMFDRRFWPGPIQNEAPASFDVASADMNPTGSTDGHDDALAYASDERASAAQKPAQADGRSVCARTCRGWSRQRGPIRPRNR